MPVLDPEDIEARQSNNTANNDTADSNDTSEFFSSAVGKKSILSEHWAKSYWRPGMAWLYMIICACDFVIFPICWAVIHAATGQPVTQWKPITLDGAGLIHLAFGAILGVAAYGRSKEKLNR